jgi:hypothetical protein
MDGALGDLQPLRQFTLGHAAPGLHEKQDREQPISLHREFPSAFNIFL